MGYLNEKKASELKKAGLDLISFSIDHYNYKIQDSLRRHKGAFKGALNAIKIVQKLGIPSSTSTVLTKQNFKEIDKVIKFISDDLNTSFTLCVPSHSPNETFFDSESKVVDFTKSELIKCTKKIILMKKKGYKVSNSMKFLKEYIDSLQGKSKYGCQGGDLVYYLDVEDNFFPCFNKKKIFDINSEWKTIKKKCYECNIQCFKEPSVVNQFNLIELISYLWFLEKQLK